MMENAKQNWFIGIRTPGTLNSEAVWDKTNRLAGKLFKWAGVLAALGTVFPEYAIFLILVPVILAAFYPIIYSYQKVPAGDESRKGKLFQVVSSIFMPPCQRYPDNGHRHPRARLDGPAMADVQIADHDFAIRG